VASASEVSRRKPITCIACCCARAASGHAAAAPPSAASNSRRPMVTVIRPSRARCVKERIPRHERAVLTARYPARAERMPGTGCNGAPPGLISRNLFSAAPLHFLLDLRDDFDARFAHFTRLVPSPRILKAEGLRLVVISKGFRKASPGHDCAQCLL